MKCFLLSLICCATLAGNSVCDAQATDNIINRYGPPTYTGGTVNSPSETYALYHQQTINQVRMTQPVTTAIAEVYPNPSATYTRVELQTNTTEPVSVSLINMNGVLMRTYEYSAGYGSFSLDVSSLPPGVYALQVQERGKQPQSIQFLKAEE